MWNLIPYSGTRTAFTLLEIAVSLAILAVVITGSALAYPVAVSAQRQARFQVIAGAKALEMLDSFAQPDRMIISQQVEAEKLGQNTFVASPMDLDRMMSSGIFDLYPLPERIARRIDSDGDEIARLLDRGGQLYYPAPHPHQLGFEVRYGYITDLGDGWGVASTTEAAGDWQSLVYAVLGDAQQNALPNHPCLAWPYYDWYPSPLQPWELDSWRINGWPGLAEAQAVGALVVPGSCAAMVGDLAQVDRYIALAQALLGATTPNPAMSAGGPLPPPPPDLRQMPAPWPASDPDCFPRPWRVLAARVLAHAAMLRTNGVLARTSPASAIETSYATAAHDACLEWATRYAAMDPYDWGAPRPLNRQVGWDFPLIQYDCFASAAHADPVAAVDDGTGDVSWRVVAGRRPTEYGQSRGSYGFAGVIPPNHAEIAGSWGDDAHFTLAARFDAAERCRQLACWAVDWRAYEDFETAPAAAIDARLCHIDSRGVQVSLGPVAIHPERHVFWGDQTRTALCPKWLWYQYENPGANPAWTVDESVGYKSRWLGLYGADRNGNQRLDAGPLPTTARLRAASVARIAFYDRRVPHALRN